MDARRVLPRDVPGDRLPCSLAGLIDSAGSRIRFGRDAEIFAEDQAADHVYQVVRGAVRLFKLTSDGRRQIAAFYLRGDVIGLEAGARHDFCAESVGSSALLAVPRTALAEAREDCDLSRELEANAVEQLRRSRQHMLLLGCRNAQQRIAAFLLKMAERLQAARIIELPMSRLDIADYLGLTIETVSRGLTQLERGGLIAIPAPRRIVLRDRRALAAGDGRLPT